MNSLGTLYLWVQIRPPEAAKYRLLLRSVAQQLLKMCLADHRRALLYVCASAPGTGSVGNEVFDGPTAQAGSGLYLAHDRLAGLVLASAAASPIPGRTCE